MVARRARCELVVQADLLSSDRLSRTKPRLKRHRLRSSTSGLDAFCLGHSCRILARRASIGALDGGGFWMGNNPLLDSFLLSLSAATRPKVFFVGTASGDAETYIRRFDQEFGKHQCTPSHFPLFSHLGRPRAPARTGRDLCRRRRDCDHARSLALSRSDAILQEAWKTRRSCGTERRVRSAGSRTRRSVDGRWDRSHWATSLVASPACSAPTRRRRGRSAAYRRLVADAFLHGQRRRGRASPFRSSEAT